MFKKEFLYHRSGNRWDYFQINRNVSSFDQSNIYFFVNSFTDRFVVYKFSYIVRHIYFVIYFYYNYAKVDCSYWIICWEYYCSYILYLKGNLYVNPRLFTYIHNAHVQSKIFKCIYVRNYILMVILQWL